MMVVFHSGVFASDGDMTQARGINTTTNTPTCLFFGGGSRNVVTVHSHETAASARVVPACRHERAPRYP